MAKLTLCVELDREELVKVLTDYCLDKAGRPQGSSAVEFLVDPQGSAVAGARVTFNGAVTKK